MLAAFGAGWFEGTAAAARAMSGRTVSVEPNPAAADRYRALMAVHGDVYAANAATFAAIKSFTNQTPAADAAVSSSG
jgi:hypothetical protein